MLKARAKGVYVTGVLGEDDSYESGRDYICPEKLDHDLQQLDYLLERGESPELAGRREVTEAPGAQCRTCILP